MSKLKKGIPSENKGYDYIFFCPGCNHTHGFMTEGNVVWQFNGDMEYPTVLPSILYSFTFFEQPKHICHSFIEKGNIRFLTDCTHKLAGKTVELPEIEII